MIPSDYGLRKQLQKVSGYVPKHVVYRQFRKSYLNGKKKACFNPNYFMGIFLLAGILLFVYYCYNFKEVILEPDKDRYNFKEVILEPDKDRYNFKEVTYESVENKKLK